MCKFTHELVLLYGCAMKMDRDPLIIHKNYHFATPDIHMDMVRVRIIATISSESMHFSK